MTSTEIKRFSIGQNRFVRVVMIKTPDFTYPAVDIREFTPKGAPSSKGVSLKPWRWTELVRSLAELDGLMTGKTHGHTRIHLGGSWFATAGGEYACVNIRRYFIPRGKEDLIPTRKGIALRRSEWDALVYYVDEINATNAELASMKRCLDEPSHNAAVGCPECQYPTAAGG